MNNVSEVARHFLAFSREYEHLLPLASQFDYQENIKNGLVSLITADINLKWPYFYDEIPFLIKAIKIPDGDYLFKIIAERKGGGELFINHEITNRFWKIVEIAYGTQTFFFHHFPKTGGTSVIRALIEKDRDNFFFPTPSLSQMHSTYGILALTNLAVNQQKSSFKNAIFAGHFPLADLLSQAIVDYDAIGISICRSPSEIISSAIRFHLGGIGSGLEPAPYYLDVDLVHSAYHQFGLPYSGVDADKVILAIRHLIDSGHLDWIRDPLRQWYYGNSVASVKEFSELLTLYPGFKISNEINQDLFKHFQYSDIYLQRKNESRISNNALINIVGQTRLNVIINELIGSSNEIYRGLFSDIPILRNNLKVSFSERSELTPPKNFQETMVDALAKNFSVKGKTVLEIASDPWLFSAKRFLDHGASRVIVSELSEGWQVVFDENIETKIIDARSITDVLDPSSVDVVYGINLLQHLYDISDALRSINDVLKPNGFCLLHGHPIWTSSRGHHAMLGHIGSKFCFHDDSNPIPLWSHLYMAPNEMTDYLVNKGCDEEYIKCILDWCFESDLITRKSRLSILNECNASELKVESVWEDRLESPSEIDIQKIRSSIWWNEDEDYSVRGLTVLFRKGDERESGLDPNPLNLSHPNTLTS